MKKSLHRQNFIETPTQSLTWNMVVMMREVVEKDEKDEAESLGLSGLQAHPIHFLSSHNTFISSLPSPSYKLPPLPSL